MKMKFNFVFSPLIYNKQWVYYIINKNIKMNNINDNDEILLYKWVVKMHNKIKLISYYAFLYLSRVFNLILKQAMSFILFFML